MLNEATIYTAPITIPIIGPTFLNFNDNNINIIVNATIITAAIELTVLAVSVYPPGFIPNTFTIVIACKHINIIPQSAITDLYLFLSIFRSLSPLFCIITITVISNLFNIVNC